MYSIDDVNVGGVLSDSVSHASLIFVAYIIWKTLICSEISVDGIPGPKMFELFIGILFCWAHVKFVSSRN